MEICILSLKKRVSTIVNLASWSLPPLIIMLLANMRRMSKREEITRKMRGKGTRRKVGRWRIDCVRRLRKM